MKPLPAYGYRRNATRRYQLKGAATLRRCPPSAIYSPLRLGGMPRYFVSYRTEDSRTQAVLLRAAARVNKRTAIDGSWVEANRDLSGAELARDTRQLLLSCDAVLVLMGPSWAYTPDVFSSTPTAMDRDDPDRCGIATALHVGVRVIQSAIFTRVVHIPHRARRLVE